MNDNLNSFLKYVFEIVEGMERERLATAAVEPVCQVCGLIYGDFKVTGKLGCANCYGAFKSHISQALVNIHGSAEYKGKIPTGQNEKYGDMLIKRDITEYRQLLKKAVEAEEYEEAAKYRDLLKSLETEN